MSSVKWTITYESGGFDILRNGRAFGYDFPSIDAAARAIRRSRRFTRTDKIIATDEDGSRVDVSPI